MSARNYDTEPTRDPQDTATRFLLIDSRSTFWVLFWETGPANSQPYTASSTYKGMVGTYHLSAKLPTQ